MSDEPKGMLELFNEMHRLKNENESLRAEMNAQAVRMDQLIDTANLSTESGKTFLGLKLHRATAMIPLPHPSLRPGDEFAEEVRRALVKVIPWEVFKVAPSGLEMDGKVAYTIYVAAMRDVPR